VFSIGSSCKRQDVEEPSYHDGRRRDEHAFLIFR